MLDSALGKRLKSARFERNDMTQEQLAAKATLSVVTIARMETAATRASDKSLRRVSLALGVSYEELTALRDQRPTRSCTR